MDKKRLNASLFLGIRILYYELGESKMQITREHVKMFLIAIASTESVSLNSQNWTQSLTILLMCNKVNSIITNISQPIYICNLWAKAQRAGKSVLSDEYIKLINKNIPGMTAQKLMESVPLAEDEMSLHFQIVEHQFKEIELRKKEHPNVKTEEDSWKYFEAHLPYKWNDNQDFIKGLFSSSNIVSLKMPKAEEEDDDEEAIKAEA